MESKKTLICGLVLAFVVGWSAVDTQSLVNADGYGAWFGVGPDTCYNGTTYDNCEWYWGEMLQCNEGDLDLCNVDYSSPTGTCYPTVNNVCTGGTQEVCRSWYDTNCG